MIQKNTLLYLWSVYYIVIILSLIALALFDLQEARWPVLITFTALASLAQLIRSEASDGQVFRPAAVFYFAGLLLLPPAFYVLMAVAAHLVEWGLEQLRRQVFLRPRNRLPFDSAVQIIAGLLGRAVYVNLTSQPGVLASPAGLLAAGGALVVYVLALHFLTVNLTALEGGLSWREAGFFRLESLATGLALASMGLNVAILYQLGPFLLLPASAPLYLIYRALAVPFLRQQASKDPKTGLWNARYFTRILEAELKRADRFNRPLTLVVADLDLLRNINNAYGHLAGDAVLIGVARILTSNFREYDVVSRFGGEEFAILLPETHPREALPRIEAVRQAIAAAEFEAPTTRQPLKATMSFGVAGRERPRQSAKEIFHQADIAVYEAKKLGRNRTFLATTADDLNNSA